MNKKEFFKYLDNVGQERIRMKVTIDRGIVTDIVVQEKHTIAIQKLEDALLYAEQDIKDRWKFYKQKYLRNIKK